MSLLLAAPTPSANLLSALTNLGVAIPQTLTVANVHKPEVIPDAKILATLYLEAVIQESEVNPQNVDPDDIQAAQFYQIGVGALAVYVNMGLIPQCISE